MAVLYTNNAASLLSASITDAATSFSVTSGHGALFPAPTGSDYFYVTLLDTAGNIEIVKVTGRSTDTFTITRGQDGTSARAFSVGDKVELRIVRAMLDDLKGERLPLTGGTLTGSTTVSGNGNGLYFTGGNNRIYFGGSYRAMEGNGDGTQLQIGEGYSATYLQSANNYATTSNHLILHAGNYTNYAAPASHTHSYLPLGGGTLTGKVIAGSSDGDSIEVRNDTASAASSGYITFKNKNGIGVYRPAARISGVNVDNAYDGDFLIETYSGGVAYKGLRVDENSDVFFYDTSGNVKFQWEAVNSRALINSNVVLHAGNYSSYAAPASHTHSYLPLSGGAVSGYVLTETTASSWGVYSKTSGYENYSGIWFSANVGELLLRKADGSLSTRIAADGSYAFINGNNILHAGNYNSYSPSLTGGNASGTWSISVTGDSGRSGGLYNNGYGSDRLTWYQSSTNWQTWTGGWASHIISNHGDGSTYYNQTIIMPFWGPPQYMRKEGGTNVGPYTFLTTENYTNYTGAYVLKAGDTMSGALTINADNGVSAIYGGTDGQTWLRGWGLETNRLTSYFRPTTNGSATLQIGYSAGSLNWGTINLDATNLYKNGNVILHAGNYTNYLGDYTYGNYRVIADYSSTNTWYIRSNGRFTWARAHDWSQSFDLSLGNGTTNSNDGWAKFGQVTSNSANGTWFGTRFMQYVGGSETDGYVRAGRYYLGNDSYYVHMGDWGLRNTTPYGWIQFGPANASWAHIYANLPFYFNQELYVNNSQVLHAGNYSSYAVPWSGSSQSGLWLFNNMGNNHSTYTDFNNVPGFGAYYVQGASNGPGFCNQYYGFTLGLGNEYAYSQYAMQFAIPRLPTGGGSVPYLGIRYREGGSWGSWQKASAGRADYALKLDGYDNQTEYTILDGPANGPVIKVRYDSATANRYIDIGYKDGYGTYSSALKFYNGDILTLSGNIGLGVSPDIRLSVNGEAHISSYLYMGGTAGSKNSWGSRDYTTSGSRYINANYFEVNNYGYGSSWSFAVDGGSSRYNGNVILHAGNYTDYPSRRIVSSYQEWDFAWGSHSTTPMSISLWDNYQQSGAPSGYGTLLDIYGMSGHQHDQLYFYQGNLIHRYGWYGNDNWNSWQTILTSSNYSSYALPLSGGTMSGAINLANNGVTYAYQFHLNNGFAITQGGSSYGQFSNWVHLPGYHGFYSTNNSAHIRPNDGTYGAWRVSGSRNGWNGIEFDVNNGNVVLMVDSSSNTTGFHNNSYGWQLYWSGGTAYVGKNSYGGNMATVLDSSNYSSYAVPISGGINMTGSYGLNDNRLYLRGNGDTNHYLWNADDDWEELVAYAGTGFRVKSSTGTSLMTFTTGAVNSGVALQQGGNQVLHAGNVSSYAIPLTSGSITTSTYVTFNGGFSASSNAYFSSGVYQTVNGIANTDYSNTVSPSLNSINNIASHTYAGKTHVGLNQTAAKRRAQALAGSGGTFGTTYGYLIDEIYVNSSLNAYTVMQQNSWSFISSYATGSLNRHFYVGSESIGPGSSQYDNLMSAGSSSARYTIVYATTGTINTSDVNEKEQIQDLDAAERRVAVAVKGLIKKFKWKDAVAKKGDAARIHIGVIAQEVEAAFVAEGLDPERYALFCKDVWWEKMVPNQNYGREDAPSEPETILETFQSEVEGGTRKERKGIRYDQLLAFVISAI